MRKSLKKYAVIDLKEPFFVLKNCKKRFLTDYQRIELVTYKYFQNGETEVIFVTDKIWKQNFENSALTVALGCGSKLRYPRELEELEPPITL